MAKIKPKRSYTVNAVPTTSDLDTNELAINWADFKAYTKDAAGNIVSVTLGGSGSVGSVDVYEFATPANFPATGAAAVIYIATDTGRTYRWAGTAYIEMGPIGGDVDSLLRSLLVPPAPTGVSAVASNAQAVVSWTAPAIVVPPVTDYSVQFSTNGGTTWTTATDTVSAATTATITGLTNDTAHVFRVAGINGIGTGAYSTQSAAVTPTASDPLFANVALLLPMDGTGNTFVDASPTPKTITANGNATQSTAQSKFGGKSAAFGGSGDSLSVPSIAFGAGDFVIECWLYLNSVGALYTGIYDARPASNGAQPTLLLSGSSIAWFTNSSFRITGSALSTGQWYHVAVARASGSTRMYVNGTQVGATYSDSTNYQSSSAPFIGRLFDGYHLDGYIDDLRITKGSNRGYTGSTITVPVEAFPARGVYEDPFFESVSLLLPMDGTGSTFTDSSLTPKAITAAGSATQSATQSKFGGKSLYLDGSGDYISIADSGNAFAFGTGDFCYEFWFRSGATSAYAALLTRPYNSAGGILMSLNGASGNGAPEIYWREFEDALFFASNAGGFNDNNWHHYVFNRSETTCRMFIDGVVRATKTGVNTSVPSSQVVVGNDLAYGGRDLNGYIDDLRITKGHARYTENFTPPTAAFPTL